jgi:hypothetical protein
MLPQMTSSNIFTSNSDKKLLILAEGFEARALNWVNDNENKLLFDKTIICKYLFHTKTRFEEVFSATKRHSVNDPDILEYNRFEPTPFEKQFLEIVDDCKDYDEIIIDITVMSKMLIMIIMYSLKQFNGRLKIIYTEPKVWGPAKEKYEKDLSQREIEETGFWIGLSSVGVSDVVRTPNLSSIIMQNNPTFLISFLSFNEKLLAALINEISPSRLQLINHSCKRQEWREEAMRKIHDDVVREYFGKDVEPMLTFDALDYRAVFDELASIYCEHCYDYRIIISPTGGKMHAIAAALLKLCCPDVHVEYPTPESYLFEGYSSEEPHAIHQIVFEDFDKFLANLSNEYKLNG